MQVRVDNGLSWRSANAYLDTALANPAIKATHLGGSTGFWQHQKTQEVSACFCMLNDACNDCMQCGFWQHQKTQEVLIAC